MHSAWCMVPGLGELIGGGRTGLFLVIAPETLCTIHHALCTMHYALPTIHYPPSDLIARTIACSSGGQHERHTSSRNRRAGPRTCRVRSVRGCRFRHSRALELLTNHQKLERVRELIAEGDASIALGEYVVVTENFMQDALERSRERSRLGLPIADHVKPVN